MSEDEYDKLFTKFYSDLFKFQSGKKSNLRCAGCSSEKRFIIDDDKLTYSCGPSSGPSSNNPKCGKQYTLHLPKHIHYRTFQQIYDEQINGSFKYRENDILQYDLGSLSQKMDVKKEFEEQKKIMKESNDKLKQLIDDYIQTNNLTEYLDNLETLSEKRYKNSIEKRKIMRSIMEDELSEPEKVVLRRKYAELIKENHGFIDIINKLIKPDIEFIMIKKPEITNHQKPKDNTKDKKDDKKDDTKYSFDDQVKILVEYYKKVDPKKTETDVIRLVNNRRPKDKDKGTRIPKKQWLELCEKLNQKYKVHPLQ
jgi:hypothetical protein